jgi:hypothetical protein
MKINEIALQKGKWQVVLSNADKQELGNDLVDLVSHAYGNTPHGSFVNSVREVIPSDWQVLDWDKDPGVDACVFYRSARGNESWRGYKIQGIGHDGQQHSKSQAVHKVHEMLQRPGTWIESSDALRAVLKRLHVESVTDEQMLKRLFNDPNLQMVDRDTYTRKLSNGQTVTETVFGQPRF